MIRIAELKLPLAALDADADPAASLTAAAPAPGAATRAETRATEAHPEHPLPALRALAAQALGLVPEAIARLLVYKRSFDARARELRVVYIVDVELAEPALEPELLQRHAAHAHIRPSPDMRWQPPVQAAPSWPARVEQRPLVLGFGPCGLFAALALAQMGLKPIVLERGRAVRDRTADTWALWRKHRLEPESNVQFGEGGAGLFSDGKLYSQIKDPRFLGRKVMQEFVAAGAPAEILYQAHPHIGTFRLVKVVQSLREQIIALGGEIRFEQRVTELLLEDAAAASARPRRLRALRVLDQRSGQTQELPCTQAVLALGHSARDSFAMLHALGVALEPKPFSIGVRIEHPQGLIDRWRWGRHAGHALLGAADYKLVHHAGNGRAVYSFCMCPGGTVVAATSEPGRVVTNGMSQYSRAERNANAGLVVAIAPADFALAQPSDLPHWQAAFGHTLGQTLSLQAQAMAAQGLVHALAGIVLQRQLEARAFVAGGGDYCAPGQRVGDFLRQQASHAFGSVLPSYQPSVRPTELDPVLPAFVTSALREALPAFGCQIPGYDLPDAVLTAVETRTSSPLRIPRADDYQSLNVHGLYPAGEGAGYAGGILSAAIDGLRVAESLACHALDQPAPPPDRHSARPELAYG